MSGPPTITSRLYAALRVLYPIALAYLLFATDLAATLGIPTDFLGWIYAGLVVAFFAIPGMLEYPVTTLGTARRVDRRPLRHPADRQCTVCGSEIAMGEHREYREQWVIFGAPVRNVDWGENDYCEVCRKHEERGPPVEAPVSVDDVRNEIADETSANRRARERDTEVE